MISGSIVNCGAYVAIDDYQFESAQVFTDDELLPVSALQHLLFCERQCALIHLERVWAENRLTVEGRVLHENAHDGPDETRGGVHIARGLPLRCTRIGLVGVADVVEFRMPDREGKRQPFPVEYKRGKPKSHDADRVQLCAQALCLEEMFDVSIPAGALFYGEPRRRTDVPFDAALRQLTEATTVRLHALFATQMTPPAVREKKCDNCSLFTLCMPDLLTKKKSASQYFDGALARSVAESTIDHQSQ